MNGKVTYSVFEGCTRRLDGDSLTRSMQSSRQLQNYGGTESPLIGVNFWLAAPQEVSHDTSILEEIVPGHISRLCNMHERERKPITPVLQVPFGPRELCQSEDIWLEVTSNKAFWILLRHDTPMRETEWGRILAVLWAMWLHRNERAGLCRPIGSFRGPLQPFLFIGHLYIIIFG